MHFPGNTRKPQIWPVLLSQNSTKIRKINRPRLWFNQFWRWSGYISMQNFTPFPPCVPGKCTKTTNLVCFTKSNWRQFHICDIETGPLFYVVHVERHLISRSLMSPELSKLRECLEILQWYARCGWAALLLSHLSNFEAIGEFEISISLLFATGWK